MGDTVRGILSHRKLMELKNSGVVCPEFFGREADQRFRFYMSAIEGALLEERSGFFGKLLYSSKKAAWEARLMFPERKDLLEHLLYMDGVFNYLRCSKEQVDEFTILHQAATASADAKRVLSCFSYSDQVIVDEDTGYNIDWLLKNAYILKQILSAKTEE